MLDIIEHFQSIIADFSISSKDIGDTFIFKIRITFVNQTKLSVFELDDSSTNNHKYGYQLMNDDNSQIRSWDNAPHYSYIPTYPFHQHIGSEENIQPSEEMTLEKVLKFVAENL
jgi:Family of unknown function (DUF6516)